MLLYRSVPRQLQIGWGVMDRDRDRHLAVSGSYYRRKTTWNIKSRNNRARGAITVTKSGESNIT